MLYMVIEHFKKGAQPVYDRLREKGRMMPDGLTYVDSWVTADHFRCFQVMACDDESLFQIWQNNWSDLMDFELIAVKTSADTVQHFKK